MNSDSRRPSRRPSQSYTSTPRNESPPPLPTNNASIRSRTGSISNSNYHSTESLSRRAPPPFEGPTSLRSRTYVDPPSLPSSAGISTQNRNLRPLIQTQSRPSERSDRDRDRDREYDHYSHQSNSSSPDHPYRPELSRSASSDRNYELVSPTTDQPRRIISRTPSNTSLSSARESSYRDAQSARKPPPPPVSRSAAQQAAGKKGPPPPPPAKRPSLTGSGGY